MNIKHGYKQTEIGILPEDWDVKKLSSCSVDGGKYGINAPACEYKFGLPRYIRITDIDANGNYCSTNQVCVKNELAMDYALELGDVVFARTGATVGKTYLYKESDGELIYAGFLIKFRINDSLYDARFIYNVCNSHNYWEWVKTVSARSGQPGINANEYGEFCFAVPPLHEQSAIAHALGDADVLISSLEKLITKKRQIKQGAMQELLTGKRRLDGFDGVWKNLKISDIAEIKSGGTPSSVIPAYWDGDVMWCIPTDITKLKGNKYIESTERTITQSGLKNSSAEIIPPHSIIMTSRATIGECAINLVPITTNQGFKNLIPIVEVTNTEFLFYIMSSKKHELLSLASGSTFLEVGKKQLSSFVIDVPPLPEQVAISKILTEMDNEISALEQKCEKYRKIKQGMMQELLTGRTRIV